MKCKVRAVVTDPEYAKLLKGHVPEGIDLKILGLPQHRFALIGMGVDFELFPDPSSHLTVIDNIDKDTFYFFLPENYAIEPSLFDQVAKAIKEDTDAVFVSTIFDKSHDSLLPEKFIPGSSFVKGSILPDCKSQTPQVIEMPLIRAIGQEIPIVFQRRAMLDPSDPRKIDKKSEIELLPVGKLVDVEVIRYPDVKLPYGLKPLKVWELPSGQRDMETLMRECQSHWILLQWEPTEIYWETIMESLVPRRDRDMILFPGMVFVHPGKFRELPPAILDFQEWVNQCKEHAYYSMFDLDGNLIGNFNTPKIVCNDPNGLKVAVLSMCGVTSFEDRYGLGGEHQVVHWLREGFLRHTEVAVCDIFDTYNLGLAQDDYYDLVLSNSCWKSPPKTKKHGLSIFWHFNTNAYQGNDQYILSLGYDMVWTNSPVSLEVFRERNIPSCLKHLNGSSFHHDPYPWDSTMFRHDVCYLGGYQTEYKGKNLIDEYIKFLLGHEFDFAIYGNRKWKFDVQQEALKTDKFFKPEHLDPSFDPYYKHVLHPDDFRILAKNCRIWINFNSADQRPLGMMNDRPIWAMCAGAFVITDDSPEQRELYGDTCDYSTGGIDLLEKVRYWLEHEDERLEKAQRACENIRRHKLTTNDTADLALEHLERKKLHGIQNICPQ